MLGCGRANDVTGPVAYEPSPPAPTWRDDKSDLLNWFLGHNRENTPTSSRGIGQGGHSLALEWEGGQHSGDSRYMKWANAQEHHRWDANFIYLVEDTSGTVPYSFSAGILFPRHAKPGDGGRADSNVITWYDKDCNPTKSYAFRYEWRFVGYFHEDFGGIVGEQDAIVVSYTWATGREERFWYTWSHGWIRWQYIENGKLTYNFTFAQPGMQVPSGRECKP